MASRRSVRENASTLNVGVLVEPAEALLHRRRTVVLGVDQIVLPPVDQELIVRPSRMPDDALGPCGDVGPRAGQDFLGEEKRAAGDGEPPLVVGRLEHRQRLLGELAESLRSPFRRLEREHVAGVIQAQAELGDTVADGCRALRRLRKARQHRLGALPGVEACPAQLDLEPSIA
jgi:hypothetical protein